MTRKTLLTAAVVTAALAAAGGAAAVSHDDDDDRGRSRRLRADLSGFNETLVALSTPGRGSFRGTLSRDETEIEWRLDYRNLEGTVTQAHIHFGITISPAASRSSCAATSGTGRWERRSARLRPPR